MGLFSRCGQFLESITCGLVSRYHRAAIWRDFLQADWRNPERPSASPSSGDLGKLMDLKVVEAAMPPVPDFSSLPLPLPAQFGLCS